MKKHHKSFLLGLSISILAITAFLFGAIADRLFVVKPLDYVLERGEQLITEQENVESTKRPLNTNSVADIVEDASASVVTVSIKRQERVFESSGDPFLDFFGGFGIGRERVEEVQRDIGTGFIVGKTDNGSLLVTNRHVVSVSEAEYLVIDSEDNEHAVTEIYRDPVNDLAILQVQDLDAKALPLGDSDKLRVGESVIAIGTALGEFRHTVTTGVVSGLGRGIEAGDALGRVVESLEGVIQTDAAINPGNSGGPLISGVTGRVVGVNVAVSASAENIGFAIPISVVKSSLELFNETGQFERPFLGVSYRMITKQTAVLNELPQGAYILEVLENTTAADAGLKEGDIITEIAGEKLSEKSLAEVINTQKVGEKVELVFYRGEDEKKVTVTLREAE